MAKKQNVKPVEQVTEPTEEKKTKVSSKQIAEQVESIKNATETIRVAISQMPDCGAKKSFTITLDALEKKVSHYSKTQGEILSDEEKEIVRKFRAGELKIEKEGEDA